MPVGAEMLHSGRLSGGLHLPTQPNRNPSFVRARAVAGPHYTAAPGWQRKKPIPRHERIGQRFGRLVIQREVEGRLPLHWHCLCDCGKPHISSHSNLTNGNTTSCGCVLAEWQKSRQGEMVGRRFGRWLVVEEVKAKKVKNGTIASYACLCDCGKKGVVGGPSLRLGRSKSCGCLLVESGRKNGLAQVVDLSGKTFGLLTVKFRIKRDIPGHALWLCQCACGKESRVLSCSLTSGNTTSCGCKTRKWASDEERKAALRLSNRISGSRRRAALRFAYKPFDPEAMKALEARLHAEAASLTEETGEVWSVDHIVPIKGPWSKELGCRVVCGLHNEHNLQVIPLKNNISKSNRWWPNMVGVE